MQQIGKNIATGIVSVAWKQRASHLDTLRKA